MEGSGGPEQPLLVGLGRGPLTAWLAETGEAREVWFKGRRMLGTLFYR